MKTLNQFLFEEERKPKTGDFKSLLPDNYWNDERLAKLEKGYNNDMSRKEMVKHLFPEANPRHIETALRKYKDKLNLKPRTTKSPTATRKFNEYWTPERKHKLRRAWRSGEDLQTMHGKHFDDISFEALRKTTRLLRTELGLKPRNIPHRQPENLISPIEKRDHEHIIKDLKKGRSIERVAADHYADPGAVKQLRVKELGPMKKYRAERPYEITPQHHIDYANELRLKHPSLVDPKVKAKAVGRALIARALNSKFGHEEGFIPYSVGQVDHMIRSGMIGGQGAQKSPEDMTHAAKRKSIWAAHQSGQPIQDIASNHGVVPSTVNRIISRIQRKVAFSTPTRKPQNINIKENYSKGIQEMTDLTKRVVQLVMEAKEEEFNTPEQKAMRRETQNYKKLHKDLARVRKIMNAHLMRLDPTSPVAKIAKRYHSMASDDMEGIFPSPKIDKSKTIKEAMTLARKRLEEAEESKKTYSGTASSLLVPKKGDHVVYANEDKKRVLGIYNNAKSAKDAAEKQDGYYSGPHKG